MSNDEKLNEIHDAVLTLKGDFKAFTQMCQMKHTAIDEKVEGLDHDVNGNGAPGLAQKHQTLQERFDKLELRLAMIVTAALFVLQIYGDKIKHFLGV